MESEHEFRCLLEWYGHPSLREWRTPQKKMQMDVGGRRRGSMYQYTFHTLTDREGHRRTFSLVDRITIAPHPEQRELLLILEQGPIAARGAFPEQAALLDERGLAELILLLQQHLCTIRLSPLNGDPVSLEYGPSEEIDE